MKIVAIWDIHWLSTRKDILEKEKDFDLCVFIGDYFDNRDGISGADEIENFKEICKLSKNDKRVVLLLGNHDRHYMLWATQRFSWYRSVQSLLAWPILSAMRNNLEIRPRYIVDDIIFSHAWLTNTRANKHNIDIQEYTQDDMLFSALAFQHTDEHDVSGTSINQWPLRVRPWYVWYYLYHPVHFKQVVGHTRTPEIYTKDWVTHIDALRNGKYLVIEDWLFIPKTI